MWGATIRLDTYPVWHYCSGNVWGQVSNSHRQNACAPRPHTATRTHQGKHGEPHVVSNKTCREAHTRLLQVQVAVLRFRCATQHSVAVFRFGNGQPVCGVGMCEVHLQWRVHALDAPAASSGRSVELPSSTDSFDSPSCFVTDPLSRPSLNSLPPSQPSQDR